MKTKKGIYRVDREENSTRGWYVMIRRASGESNRVFSDGVYGGRRASYRAACAWYEKAAAEYPLLPRLERISIIRRNNRSGMTGVYRWPASGETVPGAYWAAQWVEIPNQPPTRRKFSIALYGERKAKKMAIAARTASMDKLRKG